MTEHKTVRNPIKSMVYGTLYSMKNRKVTGLKRDSIIVRFRLRMIKI